MMMMMICRHRGSQSKKKRKQKRNKYVHLAWDLKKTMERENDAVINCNWSAQNNP